MRQGLSSNAKRYKQIQEELEASDNTIQRLEGSSDTVADQYKFLQEMRGYVRDLLECFSEKVREKLFASLFTFVVFLIFFSLFPCCGRIPEQ